VYFTSITQLPHVGATGWAPYIYAELHSSFLTMITTFPFLWPPSTCL
jgi:hypothetical protein